MPITFVLIIDNAVLDFKLNRTCNLQFDIKEYNIKTIIVVDFISLCS